MLRDLALRPLSREHQHGLALCVRLRRAAQQVNLSAAALRELREAALHFFASEGDAHFAAEEQVLFPAADRFPELRPLTQQLRAEHVELRARAAAIHEADISALADFAEALTRHIRFEENHLFERMQQLMSPEELAALAQPLEAALATAAAHCELRRT